MRILLTNHWLDHPGGTEKWVFAMAEEMKRRGHDVEAFTFIRGTSAEKIEELGVRVTDQMTDDYDLVLVNHATCLAVAQDIGGIKIFTSHGPQHRLERPNPGADAYVAVSPEVRARDIQLGINSTVICNGVNLDEFQPLHHDHHRPVVFSMCKNRGAGAMVAQAAAAQGLVFRGVHYQTNPIWDVADYLRDADLIFACGRSAAEALACGKQVVVFDNRDPRVGPCADGLLTPQNIDRLHQYNFSCRGAAMPWDQGDLEQVMATFEEDEWGRAWAQEHLDIRDKASDYLTLYTQELEKKTNG